MEAQLRSLKRRHTGWSRYNLPEEIVLGDDE
jgi:hypothetical protein